MCCRRRSQQVAGSAGPDRPRCPGGNGLCAGVRRSGRLVAEALGSSTCGRVALTSSCMGTFMRSTFSAPKVSSQRSSTGVTQGGGRRRSTLRTSRRNTSQRFWQDTAMSHLKIRAAVPYRTGIVRRLRRGRVWAGRSGLLGSPGTALPITLQTRVGPKSSVKLLRPEPQCPYCRSMAKLKCLGLVAAFVAIMAGLLAGGIFVASHVQSMGRPHP